MLEAYLVAIGTVCGISGALALVIVIADATIANYGDCTITINEEKEVVVDGGKSLLGSLKDEEIFIPSACGGRGSCGLCKCKVTAGGGDILPTELPWLNKEEQAEMVRLTCQLKVKRDMSISIPEELFNVKQFEAEVGELVDLTHDIKGVSLNLPEQMDFVAGQFIQVETPEYELTDEPIFRAYSVASCPTLCNCVQLEIKLVPDGICSTYIHKYLKEGDKLTITGPYGDFFLRDTDSEILFIATGSGMAPIRAILQQMKADGIERKARYFFGARHYEDLFLLDEMAMYEKELSDFKFFPTLSRPRPESNWEGEVGRVTDLCEKYVEEGQELEVYMCGAPIVIDSCVDVLKTKGLSEDKFYYDKFS